MGRISLRQITAYRELIATLAIKEIKIRYKSAVLGWLWSVLNPLLLMVIFTFVFTYIFRIDIKHAPLFLLAGLIPQFFLNYSLSSATTSIVENANLIKTVYFPYEIIPGSVVAANFFNYGISLLLLVGFSCFFQPLSWHVLSIPLVALLHCGFVLGVCLFTSACHTLFRDVKYAVEILQIVWFYATPIFYSLDMIPEKARVFFYLNPMTLFVHIYRDVLLYHRFPSLYLWLGCAAATALALGMGAAIFAAKKRIFVDVT